MREILSFKRDKKSSFGMPPGSIVYVGAEREVAPRVSLMQYDPQGVKESESGSVDKCRAALSGNKKNWINIDGIHDVNLIRDIGEQFELHPLVLEAVANTHQRPKTEMFGKNFFTVVKMLRLDEDGAQIIAEQVSFVLTEDCLITFQEQQGDVFDIVRNRIREGGGRIRGTDISYLFYSLLDAIVDSYFLILESAGDRLAGLEEAMTQNPEPDILNRLHRMKRDVVFLRRCVWPLRDVVNSIARDGETGMSEDTRVFLRDLHDHTVQIMDAIESYRDILSGLTDLYLSIVSNRMNEVMKTLTIIATIFIPLTFVAGIYGMNFQHMPELARPWAYPAVLGVMLLMAVGMLVYFRRKDWL